MVKRRKKLVGLILLVIGVAVAFILMQRPFSWPISDEASAQQEFTKWLDEKDERRAEFNAFVALLEDNGVARVVPPEHLLRVSPQYVKKCGLPAFHMPPPKLWPNIVRPLQLVRDEVIPIVGAVELRSSYRSEEVNLCARGASRSHHMRFAALDIAPVGDANGVPLFRKLCSMHDKVGAARQMGLGAYYDAEKPDRIYDRFHIDASGYRRWGHDFTAKSDPCPKLVG